MDRFLQKNQAFWDRQVKKGNIWTMPVSKETIEKAKKGKWSIVITSTKPVPENWFPKELKNKKILCLASGGGQQGPILAALGADVTVFDYSYEQLKQDDLVAKRENLVIKTIHGDMRDLSVFKDDTFDLIIHPVSSCYVDSVLPVYQEAYRVLKNGGAFLSGFVNPIRYIFDIRQYDLGKLVVKHKIPYSDYDLSEQDFKDLITDLEYGIEFGHSLEDLIQGQIGAGFLIAGYYGDKCGKDDLLDQYIDSFTATKAIKL